MTFNLPGSISIVPMHCLTGRAIEASLITRERSRWRGNGLRWRPGATARRRLIMPGTALSDLRFRNRSVGAENDHRCANAA